MPGLGAFDAPASNSHPPLHTDARVAGVDAGELLAAIGHAIIITDPDESVLAWNDAAESLYGWSADEAVGKDVRTLCLAQLPSHVLADIRHARQARTPWSGALLVRRKDGTAFPALVTETTLSREDRLAGVVIASTDIGPAAAPLLERSSDAALMLRDDSTISYASSAVRQLFGWDEQALLGADLTLLLHSADRPAVDACLRRVLTSPGTHPPIEFRVRGRGGWIWTEAALTNMLDDPSVRGVVCHLRPSPHRAAREAAEERSRQLQTALDSRIVLEQAKGWLMATHRISEQEAFELLRGYARHQGSKVHDVARRLLVGELRLSPHP